MAISSQDESQAVEAMKTFLEKQHALDMEKARKQWKVEHDAEITRIVNEETTKIRKEADEVLLSHFIPFFILIHFSHYYSYFIPTIFHCSLNLYQEKATEIEKRLQEAETAWSKRDTIEFDNRLSSAKKECIKEQEQHMIERISVAVQEARKTWQELQQKDVKEQVEKAVGDAKVRKGSNERK